MRQGNIESKTIEDKQDKLIVGDGINIENNVISSTVSGNTVSFDSLTPEQQDSLKGEKGDKGSTGDSFKISKIFTSAEEFYSYNPDTNEVLNGEFVIINNETNLDDPENGKVYQRGNFSWEYIVDMSAGGSAFDPTILNNYQEKLIFGDGLIYEELNKKLSVDMATTTGQSEYITMTQKAITDAIGSGGGTTLPSNSDYSVVKEGGLVDIGTRLINLDIPSETETYSPGDYQPPYYFAGMLLTTSDAPIYAYIKDTVAGKKLKTISILVSSHNNASSIVFGYTIANSIEELRDKVIAQNLTGPEVELGTLNFPMGIEDWALFDLTTFNPSVNIYDSNLVNIDGIDIPENAYMVYGKRGEDWNPQMLGLFQLAPESAGDSSLRIGSYYKSMTNDIHTLPDFELLAVKYDVGVPAYSGYEVPIINELDTRISLLEHNQSGDGGSTSVGYPGSSSDFIDLLATSYTAPANGWLTISAMPKSTATTIVNMYVSVGSLSYSACIIPPNLSPNNTAQITNLIVPIEAYQMVSWSNNDPVNVSYVNIRFIASNE